LPVELLLTVKPAPVEELVILAASVVEALVSTNALPVVAVKLIVSPLVEVTSRPLPELVLAIFMVVPVDALVK